MAGIEGSSSSWRLQSKRRTEGVKAELGAVGFRQFYTDYKPPSRSVSNPRSGLVHAEFGIMPATAMALPRPRKVPMPQSKSLVLKGKKAVVEPRRPASAERERRHFTPRSGAEVQELRLAPGAGSRRLLGSTAGHVSDQTDMEWGTAADLYGAQKQFPEWRQTNPVIPQTSRPVSLPFDFAVKDARAPYYAHTFRGRYIHTTVPTAGHEVVAAGVSTAIPTQTLAESTLTTSGEQTHSTSAAAGERQSSARYAPALSARSASAMSARPASAAMSPARGSSPLPSALRRAGSRASTPLSADGRPFSVRFAGNEPQLETVLQDSTDAAAAAAGAAAAGTSASAPLEDQYDTIDVLDSHSGGASLHQQQQQQKTLIARRGVDSDMTIRVRPSTARARLQQTVEGPLGRISTYTTATAAAAAAAGTGAIAVTIPPPPPPLPQGHSLRGRPPLSARSARSAVDMSGVSAGPQRYHYLSGSLTDRPAASAQPASIVTLAERAEKYLHAALNPHTPARQELQNYHPVLQQHSLVPHSLRSRASQAAPFDPALYTLPLRAQTHRPASAPTARMGVRGVNDDGGEQGYRGLVVARVARPAPPPPSLYRSLIARSRLY